MKAIILAGGRGERLKPFTYKCPKPMVEVGGKPVLEHVINLFIKNDIKDLIICLCYLPKKITTYFGSGRKFGVQIKYVYEKENRPLGTAGALFKTRKYIKNTFIVAYGDILREIDIKEMVELHRRNKASATVAVYKNYGVSPKSLVRFKQNSLISAFYERPNLKNYKNNFVWSNASLYIFEPEIFNYLSKNRPSDFGRDIFPQLIAAGEKIIAYKQKGFLLDIGNLKKLKEAEYYFSQRDG